MSVIKAEVILHTFSSAVSLLLCFKLVHFHISWRAAATNCPSEEQRGLQAEVEEVFRGCFHKASYSTKSLRRGETLLGEGGGLLRGLRVS